MVWFAQNGFFRIYRFITRKQQFLCKGVQKQMENNERKNEIEIDLVPILKAIWSKLWLIVLVGVLVAAMAYAATKIFIKPTYRCGFTAYVNNQHSSESLSNQDISAGKQLVDTYVTVIRSNKILTAAAEYIMYSLLGFLLGAVLIIIKVIVNTLTDDKVKNLQEIEERFSLPILGVIPDVLQAADEKGKGYYAYGYGYGGRSSSKSKDKGKQGEK